jgi:IclR family pca regulon transcriptional regulator
VSIEWTPAPLICIGVASKGKRIDIGMVKLARENGRNPSEFVTAVERGFAVLTAFGRGPTRMTLTQIAEATSLTRGTARRFLLTLQTLHYVDGDGKLFWLTPKVMQFSGAYLASNGIAEAARQVIRSLTETLGESSSVAVLDGLDVVYIARVETRRIFSSGLDVGSRLPAYCSSLGRVLLAGLADPELEVWLQGAPFEQRTPRTLFTREQVLTRVQETRKLNYALVDGEVEIGVRSIAVPVRDAGGRTIAALNVGTSAARVPLDQMKKKVLPELRRAAEAIQSNIRAWALHPFG